MKLINSKILILMFSIMSIFALSGCGSSGATSEHGLLGDGPDGTNPPVTITQLIIDPITSTKFSGSSQAYTVTAVLESGEKVDVTGESTYSSSDTAVATIDSKGVALTLSVGISTITASYLNTSVEASLTVVALNVGIAELVIDPVKSTKFVGGTEKYTVAAILESGARIDVTGESTYSSSDTAVATVDANGVASALSAGETTITAKFLAHTVEASLTVVALNVGIAELVIDPVKSTKFVNGTEKYTVAAILESGARIDVTGESTYSSSDTAVATVDANGVASALSAGETTITAKFFDHTVTASLSVTAATLTSIDVTPLTASVATGASVQYTAIGTFSDGSTLDITAHDSIGWRTTNKNVAALDGAGLASTGDAGTAEISAVAVGITSNVVSLEVTNATLVSIDVTPLTASVATGASVQYTAIGTFSDGSTLDITAHDSIGWRTTNKNVAALDGAGLASTGDAGTAEISAVAVGITSNVVSLEVTAVICGSLEDIVSLKIYHDNDTFIMTVGDTDNFYLFGVWSNGCEQDITNESGVSFTTPSSELTISNAGIAEALIETTKGDATITGEYDGLSVNANITIDAP